MFCNKLTNKNKRETNKTKEKVLTLYLEQSII